MDVATQHRLNIAQATVKMSDVMIRVLGGMTRAEAEAIIRDHAEQVATAKKIGRRT